MKRITSFIVLSVCVFLITSGFKTESQTCKVETNGIYVFPLDAEMSACLRFYDDGTVLASSSTNDYKEVLTWFNKENKDRVLSGKYKIKGCEIKFEVKGESGKQEYKGIITGNEIKFTLGNKSDKATGSRTYLFTQM